MRMNVATTMKHLGIRKTVGIDYTTAESTGDSNHNELKRL
jgi:hypothetical protein